jgi:hypothetical protein
MVFSDVSSLQKRTQKLARNYLYLEVGSASCHKQTYVDFFTKNAKIVYLYENYSEDIKYGTRI